MFGCTTRCLWFVSRLTARENIAYFGQLQGMMEIIGARRIDELNELLDMK